MHEKKPLNLVQMKLHYSKDSYHLLLNKIIFYYSYPKTMVVTYKGSRITPH